MGILRIDQVNSGMVLAANVRAPNGRLLIASGRELTERQLLVLRTWGIQEIDIVGGGIEDNSRPPLPAEVSPQQLEQAKQILRPLFELANRDHPAMQELFRLAVLRKTGHV